MSKIYAASQNKTKFVDRFFLSYTNEEEWLNSMAQKGMHLVKKTFYRYYFKYDSDMNCKYTVEVLDHPADSPVNSQYIEAKRNAGAELVASYKCRAYFKISSNGYSAERTIASKTRMRTVATMFSVHLMLFLTSVAMFVYNCVSCLNFTVENSKETMSDLVAEFSFFGFFEKLSSLLGLHKLLGNYQSTPLVLMFFMLVVAFSIPTAVYLREIVVTKSIRKKK